MVHDRDRSERTVKAASSFLARWAGARAEFYRLTASHQTLSVVLRRSDKTNLVLACLGPLKIRGPVSWGGAALSVSRVALPDGTHEGFLLRDVAADVEVLCESLEVSENVKRYGLDETSKEPESEMSDSRDLSERLNGYAAELAPWRGAMAIMRELTHEGRCLRILVQREDGGDNLVLDCVGTRHIKGSHWWEKNELVVTALPHSDGGGFFVKDEAADVEIVCAAVSMRENVKLY